jgi:hypothetical protein
MFDGRCGCPHGGGVHVPSVNGRAMFPGQEDLVGDGEIQKGFLLCPSKACANLKFGWYGIRWSQGEASIEIVWFSIHRGIVHFARCTGLIQKFEVSQSPNY